ncbi:hypothetical protein [Streptomyces ureilyticus]|uniref:Uncharacterized protein n=1 Tax=Streptomyces ureilyticus TaxID=1775131 RepID=A0ABX0DGG6_9ACTN|nr:hypothetical protein [Streptomyces ureilyticus]NGO40657.1 hypothetical protein [Streptomyces ureilyticus]
MELVAFGRSFSSAEALARDRRCEVTLVTLKARLAAGISPDKAVLRRKGMSRERDYLLAFGDEKTLRAWEDDPRCAVDGWHLRKRLLDGLPPEEALATPLAPDAVDRAGIPVVARPPAQYGAFGERKTLEAWSTDERCEVSYIVLRSRVLGGTPLEQALRSDSQRQGYTAFGETKSLREWSQDERCEVSRSTLTKRVQEGTPLLEALAEHRPVYEAFGEKKSIRAWAKDKRCVVTLDRLRKRLESGWKAVDALTTPVRATKSFTAFGESKTLDEWLADSRFDVSRAQLKMRLMTRGWDPEDALTRPKSAKQPLTKEEQRQRAARSSRHAATS